MIIRGIGYRAFYVKNDFVKGNLVGNKDGRSEIAITEQKSAAVDQPFSVHLEYPYSKYLIIRAGHTTDLYQPIPIGIFIKTLKKDRKLVVYGRNQTSVNYISKQIAQYRIPSVYTGRGIRFKRQKIIRKAGKKDKQKGKVF